MRQLLARLCATTLLAAVLVGCSQLVPDSGAPTATPSADAAPEPSTEPSVDTAPKPPDAPESVEPMPFTTYPARPISKTKMQSLAAELKAGKHPLEQAVPGSERVVLSKRFVGPHEFKVPASVDGKALFWSTSCLGSGHVTVEISDDSGFTYGGESSCSLGWGGSLISDLSGPGVVRIDAHREAEVQFDMVTFEEVPRADDEATLIDAVSQSEGVVPGSVVSLASDELTGPSQIVLPEARTGNHLVVLLSCPQFTQVALQLADADGPIPATEYLGACLSGEAWGMADWADPDPARELTLTAAPYTGTGTGTGTTMRLQIFGYATDGSGD